MFCMTVNASKDVKLVNCLLAELKHFSINMDDEKFLNNINWYESFALVKN